jgi:hypothetical protein
MGNYADSVRLQDCALGTPEETAAAFVEAEKRLKRFEGITFRNRTKNWIVKLCLYSGHDEREPIPDGYVEDTGVHTLLNIGPGEQKEGFIQHQIHCLATRVKCAVKMKSLNTGNEHDLTLRDRVSSEGNYFRRCTFGIVPANREVSATEIVFSAQTVEEDIDLPVQIVDEDGNLLEL